jgi:hypothetical protein
MEPRSKIPPQPLPPPPLGLGHSEMIWPWTKYFQRRRAARRMAAWEKECRKADVRGDGAADDAG